MVRTILLGMMVVVFGAIASLAAPDPKPDLAGVYQCDGINPDGSAYRGVVEIAKVQDTFRVRWTLRDDTSVVGVGILSSGVLAVSYFGGSPAVVVYKIDGNQLIGEWTMGGAEGGVYSETLTRVAVAPNQLPQTPERPREKAPKPQPRESGFHI